MRHLPDMKSIKLALAVMVGIAGLTACDMLSGRETPGQYATDTAISAKVKMAFTQDPVIAAKPFQINVETMQGVVLLSGFVDSKELEQRAINVASKVEGVKSVKDGMETPKTYKK